VGAREAGAAPEDQENGRGKATKKFQFGETE